MYVFYSVNLLNQTHVFIHSGVKEFKYQICNKAYAQPRYLKKHLYFHEKAKQLAFKCNFCEKTFSHSNQLTSHVITHTQDKVYNCKFCPRDFRSLGDLKYHIRGYTNEKPFKSHHSGQEFKFHPDLKKHSKVHLRKNKNPNSNAEILRPHIFVKRCEVRLERLVT